MVSTSSRAVDPARREKALRVCRRLMQEYGDEPWQPSRDPLSELVRTILSQNTSDYNSDRAFQSLLDSFPTWEAVRDAPAEAIADAIKVGGLANVKAPRIKRILEELSSKNGLHLDFLADMDPQEAKAWLRAIDGVGPKTAACVLMFSLGKPVLPVDTHVYRVSRRLGLIDARTSAEAAHDVLEAMLSPEAIYHFHVHMIKHGRLVCKAQRPCAPECVLQGECDYFKSVALGGLTAEPQGAQRNGEGKRL